MRTQSESELIDLARDTAEFLNDYGDGAPDAGGFAQGCSKLAARINELLERLGEKR